jgi:hypothetical protein
MSGIGQFTYVLNGDSRLPYGEDDAWGVYPAILLGPRESPAHPVPPEAIAEFRCEGTPQPA